MSERISIEELARRTGEPVERLEKWRERGIIGSPEAEDFGREDIGRAMLVHDLLHYGMTAEVIGQAASDPDSVFCHYLDEMGGRYANPTYSVPEIVERFGIDLEQARRLLEAGGVHEPGDMLDDQDVAFLRSCKVALDAGMPEDALLQILRVYSDNMARIAEVS
ncbi:MAG: MerR family transcriptional regulator, partial [Dehalococcoidia bacterium]